MAEHLSKATSFARQAEELLADIEDPGQKATVSALLAIAHGVMETGYDLEHVRDAIQEVNVG